MPDNVRALEQSSQITITPIDQPPIDRQAARTAVTDADTFLAQYRELYQQTEAVHQSSRDEQKKETAARELKYFLYSTSFLNELVSWVSTGEMNTQLEALFQRAKVDDKNQAALRTMLEPQLAQLNNVLDTLLDKLYENPTNPTQEQKLDSAQFNQQLAEHLLKGVLAKRSSVEYRQTMIFAEILKAAGENGPGADILKPLLSGCAAQVGITRALHGHEEPRPGEQPKKPDYFVIWANHEDRQELKDWDLTGVDFVAIDQKGDVLFIDSKGRSRIVVGADSQEAPDEDEIKATAQSRPMNAIMEGMLGSAVVNTTVQVTERPIRESHFIVYQQVRAYLEKLANENPPGETAQQYQEIIQAALARPMEVFQQENKKPRNFKRLRVRVPTDPSMLSSIGELSPELENELKQKIQNLNAPRPVNSQLIGDLVRNGKGPISA
jgi:hypothetical protein